MNTLDGQCDVPTTHVVVFRISLAYWHLWDTQKMWFSNWIRKKSIFLMCACELLRRIIRSVSIQMMMNEFLVFVSGMKCQDINTSIESYI
jgi:hypothetical protein